MLKDKRRNSIDSVYVKVTQRLNILEIQTHISFKSVRIVLKP